MMIRFFKITFYLMVFSFTYSSVIAEEFPVPPQLKDNVDFWYKIYTELPSSMGFIHDRKYPLIIYKKISVNKNNYKERNRKIKFEIKNVKNILSSILEKNMTGLNSQESKILSMFDQYATKENIKTAANRIRFQQGQRDNFLKGLERSGAYLDSIKRIISDYDLPERIAYLPHVESSFNYEAYSKVGAAGIWQFMRSTGKRYMKINYSIDERRDPLVATHAAAKLLQYNYNSIHSWPLAITAYNHGLNGMKRAVKITGSRDFGVILDKYKSRSFQFASRNFYSCFIAASNIAMNYKEYFSNVNFYKPVTYVNFEIPYYMRPTLLSQTANISLSILRQMNPAIRPSVFSHNSYIPKKTMIHFPSNTDLSLVKLRIEKLPDNMKVVALPRPSFYRVKRGDNLISIAKKFSVGIMDIVNANNIGSKNRIYRGELLRIPGEVKTLAVPKKKIAVDTELTSLPDTVKSIVLMSADTLPKITFSVTASANFDPEIYNLDVDEFDSRGYTKIKVGVDETLGHYADWLSIPTMKLRRLNHLGRCSIIKIGRSLKIPATGELLKTFIQKRVEYHMSIEEDFYASYHVSELKEKVLKRGDNLWSIVNEEGVIPMWLLNKYNKNSDLSTLYPGMKILIPAISSNSENSSALQKSVKNRYFESMNGFSTSSGFLIR